MSDRSQSAADATNPYPPGTFAAQAWEMRRAFARLNAAVRRQIEEDAAWMKAAVRPLATFRKHAIESFKSRPSDHPGRGRAPEDQDSQQPGGR